MSFNVLIVCDHKWRDLAGLVWLKLLLEEKRPQWHVAIVAKFKMFDYVDIFPPSLVIMPSSNDPWLKYAKEFRSLGAATIILPTEGRPTFGKSMEWSVSSHDRNQADGILLWSETMREIWANVDHPNAIHGKVVGCSRFDFYRPPLSGLLLSAPELAREIGAPIDRPIVSWATTYPHAKFKGEGEQWQIEDWKRMNFGKLGLDESGMKNWIYREYDGRERTWEALRQCAVTMPSISFCVKPHPFEDYSWCEEKVRMFQENGIDNVFLIRGLCIWDLLNATSLHIHRTCTTGTEAWLLGKPTIEADFIPSHTSALEDGARYPGAARDAEGAEDHVCNRAELIEKIEKYLAGAQPPADLVRKRHEYIMRWYGEDDGHATARAVTSICEWVDDLHPEQHPFWTGRGLKTRVIMRVKDALHFPFDESFRHPGSPVRNKVDHIGHWDRTICQRDVLEWERRLIHIVRSTHNLAERG